MFTYLNCLLIDNNYFLVFLEVAHITRNLFWSFLLALCHMLHFSLECSSSLNFTLFAADCGGSSQRWLCTAVTWGILRMPKTQAVFVLRTQGTGAGIPVFQSFLGDSHAGTRLRMDSVDLKKRENISSFEDTDWLTSRDKIICVGNCLWP